MERFEGALDTVVFKYEQQTQTNLHPIFYTGFTISTKVSIIFEA